MSHSLTSNVKRTEGAIRPQINEYEENTIYERTEVERTEVEKTDIKRPSIDYERTGLADQIVAIPLEIQKGKYQSPQTRQCIIDDDIKWQEFEYQKKVSFDYYSKQTPFNYNDFYDDIISIVQIVFGKDKHNGLIKKTIVEKTILELLQ